jgi:hypothetical protein
MLKAMACTAFIAASVLSQSSVAQESTPGVENVAPGVRVIHGDQVPSIGVDAAALEAMIKQKHSFDAAKDLLGGEGVDSVGPGGTTVHIYKAHDTVTAKNLVVILFVKDDAIVNYLIQDVTPKPAGAGQQ